MWLVILNERTYLEIERKLGAIRMTLKQSGIQELGVETQWKNHEGIKGK